MSARCIVTLHLVSLSAVSTLLAPSPYTSHAALAGQRRGSSDDAGVTHPGHTIPSASFGLIERTIRGGNELLQRRNSRVRNARDTHAARQVHGDVIDVEPVPGDLFANALG